MKSTEVPTFKSPFIGRKGQNPITRILPMDQFVKAHVVSVHIPDHLQEFVTACHRACFDKAENRWDLKEIMKYIGEGKTLWQCGEIIRFGVVCHPVTRVFTHQLVRARVGVSYSQQCSGDIDCRHLDCIMPNCYLGDGKTGIRNCFIDSCLGSKMRYASAVDGYGISIQEARYMLPGALTSWIMMDIALGSLAELYNKRCCTMTQTWEMVVWSRSLLWQIAQKAPWAIPLFRGCSNGCWFTRTMKTPFANTHLWAPDEVHDGEDSWNPATFVHFDKTHEKVSSGPERYDPYYFYGFQEISAKDYEAKAKEYGLA